MNAEDPQVVDTITRWLELNVGPVREITRQDRWRPAWDAIVDGPEGAIPLYVRAGRGEGLETRPLSHEYAVLRLLEAKGVPVPKLYGWCPEPEAIVMEGVADQPFHGGAHENPELHGIVQDYMAILADIHRISLDDVAEAGIEIPNRSEDVALAYFRLADKAYQAGKTQPEPLIEFLRQWALANIPQNRTEMCLLVADAPQFFHNDETVTAIYDLEMAHVGDPMMELASVRVRDINEPIGDMPRLFDRYLAEGGAAIDWSALDYHTLVSFLAVPMMTRSTFSEKHPHPAFVEYLSWNLACSRAALEVLAEVSGTTLEPVEDVVMSAGTFADAYDDLVALAEDLPAPEGLLREAPVLSLARYLRRVDEIGGAIERLEHEDAQAIIGGRFETRAEAEAALEEFVRENGQSRQAELLRLFHRRMMRRLQLLRGYPAPIVTRGLGRTR